MLPAENCLEGHASYRFCTGIPLRPLSFVGACTAYERCDETWEG